MQIIAISEIPTTQASHIIRKGGTMRQALLSASEPDGLNFRFIRSQYQSGDAAFESPRHHHAFQQVRFTESGIVNYAPGRYIPEGDLAYFPRGAFYGPQRKDQGVGLLLQFGFHGEHQTGPEWARHRETALKNLNSKGRLEGGIYYEKDAVTGQETMCDAAQAIYEQQYLAQTGREFRIPPRGLR
ncbi:hypothetical protein N7468_002253 [Penicillium chermesinum]|uniref:Cupin domain-containing protein n=1 Tax=Penicillium chermesinum TaxID=63820 RepID=A0A9W9TXG1_9EURO|nr:uncharacterized protein N7468_002253 [Penicillium chermesinum]KAJ5247270.1 hypothetical protein N7468_002253 [Penicillium chermesinum]